MFIPVMFAAIILLAIAFIGFAIQIIVKKSGKFPETSIGHNEEMRKRGISCVKCDENKGCLAQRNKDNKMNDNSKKE